MSDTVKAIANKKKKDHKIFSVVQRIGGSFMLPIAILPAAGILLGLGGAFTSDAMIKAYHLEYILGPGTFLHSVFVIFNVVGNTVFSNLALLFAVGVALGMAKQEKAVAAISAAIAFLVMHATISACLQIKNPSMFNMYTESGNKNVDFIGNDASGKYSQVLGIWSLEMGVFGGIIIGFLVSILHNRYYKIVLPRVLSFFGGVRFIPIISTFAAVIVGAISFFVWPYIQEAFKAIGWVVQVSGIYGSFVYGVIERSLIPFGLHHVFYAPFWWTDVGGTWINSLGKSFSGAQNIFFAQLADGASFSVDQTRFMTGKFPFMIFGLPAAAFAMYRCAKPENKKKVMGLLASAGFTAALTGITEPIEFTFLFIAPALYGIHCLLAGLSFFLMHLLNVTVGMTFSGGIIDLFLFGILQHNTNWYWIVIVGIGYALIYYFLFTFLIKKWNLATPGRGEAIDEIKLYTKKDYLEKKGKLNSNNQSIGISKEIALIIVGLGGADNIESMDACMTKLRCTLKDSSKANKELLQESGALGVFISGNGLSAVFGIRAANIRSEVLDALDTPEGQAIGVDYFTKKQQDNNQEKNGDQQEEQVSKIDIEADNKK